MLADTLFRVQRADGLQLLQQRGTRGASELTSWRLHLPAGSRRPTRHPPKKRSSSCRRVAADSRPAPGDGMSAAKECSPNGRPRCACRPGEPIIVHAETPLEAVLVSTPAPAGGEVAIVCAQDVDPQKRGRDLYAREVHNLFVTDPHVRRLMVGETFNPPGHWSSFPPHKHDGRDGEPVLEEVYHYRIDPPQGFGHQMLYFG